MKKMYLKPELEVTELLVEDILTISNDDVGDDEKEVIMNGDSLFN